MMEEVRVKRPANVERKEVKLPAYYPPAVVPRRSLTEHCGFSRLSTPVDVEPCLRNWTRSIYHHHFLCMHMAPDSNAVIPEYLGLKEDALAGESDDDADGFIRTLVQLSLPVVSSIKPNFLHVKELGVGSYGRVSLMKSPDDVFHIVKESKRLKSRASKSSFRSFLTEVVIRKYIETYIPEIPIDKIVAVFSEQSDTSSSNTYGVAMQCDVDRKDGLSLDCVLNPINRVDGRASNMFSHTAMYDVLLEVAIQMDRLHKAGIVHRDLDLCNIIVEYTINREMIVKLIDFGNSQFTSHAVHVRDFLDKNAQCADWIICRNQYKLPQEKSLWEGEKCLGIPVAGHLRALDPLVVYLGDELQYVNLYAADVFAFGSMLAQIRNCFTKFSTNCNERNHCVNPANVLRMLKDPVLKNDFLPMRLHENENILHPDLWNLIQQCCEIDHPHTRITFGGIVDYMKNHEAGLKLALQRAKRIRRDANAGNLQN
eukprot:ANDGO_05668.mRNA.1 hypothetical protein